MNPQEYNKDGGQWRPKPVMLQAQHYTPGPPPGPPPGWNTGWYPQQNQQQHGYWVPPPHQQHHHLAGGCHPPPHPHAVAHGGGPMFHQQYHQPVRHAPHVNPHASRFTNYLSSKPPPGTHKRRRKKDIVPPVEKMTQDAVVRKPIDESERLEIEAWKAERRKHWPSAENIQRKQNDSASDTRKIRLVDVLGTQKKLGLTRKAGTDELVKQHLRGPRGVEKKQYKKMENPVVKSSYKKKPTLLERLLEKDIKMYKAKIVQMFHFVHMNDYLRDTQKPLLFPQGTLSEEKEHSSKHDAKQSIVPYDDTSSSGSETTNSSG